MEITLFKGRQESNLAILNRLGCFLCAKMKLMNELLLIGIISLASISVAAALKSRSILRAKVAAVQIKDKPMTYCNPLTFPVSCAPANHRAYL